MMAQSLRREIAVEEHENTPLAPTKRYSRNSVTCALAQPEIEAKVSGLGGLGSRFFRGGGGSNSPRSANGSEAAKRNKRMTFSIRRITLRAKGDSMTEIEFHKEWAKWNETMRPENKEAVLLDLIDDPEGLLRLVGDSSDLIRK
jgi:hypothetical protein